MDKQLPPRPNLDHLRRQAKALLADLVSGDAKAISTFRKHLPSAKSMTPEQVRAGGFRLADAQSAVARKSGFAAWPQLARHVDQLRALEGTWEFARLEVDGSAVPASALATSRILIDGDRFRTDAPDAVYEGVFNINVEAQPHEIDIEFVDGPEAGNWNYGIFRVNHDRLEICLDLNGKPRPKAFGTRPGSGHAFETLVRTAPTRPEGVTGGTPPTTPSAPTTSDASDFAFVESATLARLQGDWAAVKTVRDGKALPKMMLLTGRRSVTKNELAVSFGGRRMIHAWLRIDETTDPVHVDYYNLDGPAKGTVQHGLLKWIGEDSCVCMAPPGQPRPTDFTCPPGSGYILSHWRRQEE